MKAEQGALLGVRHYFHPPVMGQGDLIGDVQAKPQALLRCFGQWPGERLEQLAQGRRSDGSTPVVHAEHEFAVSNGCFDGHRAIWVAMDQGIGNEVGEQLGHPFAVTAQAIEGADVQDDLALRMHTLQFRGDMPEAFGQVRAGLLVQGDACA